jgi:hypothetical protein
MIAGRDKDWRGLPPGTGEVASGTVGVEVEGTSSRQLEQALYSALGQVILSMRLSSPSVTYALEQFRTTQNDGVNWKRSQLILLTSLTSACISSHQITLLAWRSNDPTQRSN